MTRLTVLLQRSEFSGIFSAYVVMDSADGPTCGSNVLNNRAIKILEHAKLEVRQALSLKIPGVLIEWVSGDHS